MGVIVHRSAWSQKTEGGEELTTGLVTGQSGDINQNRISAILYKTWIPQRATTKECFYRHKGTSSLLETA